jgi:4'-phosphopantetheinyl transferase
MVKERVAQNGPRLAPADGVVDVWSVNLTDAAPLAGLARTLLSRDERERADRFRFPRLQTDFALSRGLLRALLARACGCAPSEVTFAYGAQGKPALANETDVRFNLSHSGEIAVYAVVSGLEVGIDVEQQRPMDDLDAIARRFLSPLEQKALDSVGPERRLDAFFHCWVCKEAYIKALGQGLALLDSFSVSVLPGDTASLLEVRNQPDEPAAWSLGAFTPAPGYHAAVAVRSRSVPIRVRRLEAEELLTRVP